jgi:hypothetical protein
VRVSGVFQAKVPPGGDDQRDGLNKPTPDGASRCGSRKACRGLLLPTQGRIARLNQAHSCVLWWKLRLNNVVMLDGMGQRVVLMS